MKKIFLKQNLILKENDSKRFKKNQIKIKESDSNAYVTSSNGSNGSMTSLGSDINNTRTNNPNDDNFVVDLSSYDNSNHNNPVSLDVSASNGNEAQRKIQNDINSNPQLKSMMNKGQLNANVHIKEEYIRNLRENSIPFTKEEMNEILFN